MLTNMEFYHENRAERKLSDDLDFDSTKFLSQSGTRRFTADNSYNVYHRPKKRPDSPKSVENYGKSGGVAKTMSKFLFGRKPQKSEANNTYLTRHETVSEKTERIKAILERDTFGSRPRSNSEASTQYSIMKKETCFGPLTVLGMIEPNTINILGKILTHFTCYDLMSQYCLSITVDSDLTLQKTLEILTKHQVKEVPVWDSRSHSYVGSISLGRIVSYATLDTADIYNRLQRKISDCQFFKEQIQVNNIMVDSELDLQNASKMLIHNDIDTLYVFDQNLGNVLKPFGSNDILMFLYGQVSQFGLHINEKHTPVETLLEPWKKSQFVSKDTTVKEALARFVDNELILVFIEQTCKTFLTIFSLWDVAQFLAEMTEDELKLYISQPLWMILDSRKSINQVKSAKYFPSTPYQTVASACECMLLSKSEGIIVWKGQMPLGYINPKTILTSFVDQPEQESNVSKSEVFRL